MGTQLLMCTSENYSEAIGYPWASMGNPNLHQTPLPNQNMDRPRSNFPDDTTHTKTYYWGGSPPPRKNEFGKWFGLVWLCFVWLWRGWD